MLVNTNQPLISYELPTPPAELPTEIVNTLNGYSPEQPQHVARYAKELAEHKAREGRLEESDEDETGERPDDLPDEVPARATITIKEIDGYWDAKPKTKKEKIREVAERVEYSSHGDLAKHINRNEDFDVVRTYVSEALRESQSKTQRVYVAIWHEYEKIDQHTWTTHGRMWKVAESGLNDEAR